MILVVVTPRSDLSCKAPLPNIGKKSVPPPVLLHLPIYRVLGTFTCINHGSRRRMDFNFRMQTNIDWARFSAIVTRQTAGSLRLEGDRRNNRDALTEYEKNKKKLFNICDLISQSEIGRSYRQKSEKNDLESATPWCPIESIASVVLQSSNLRT
jgi:hypothetical protein